MNRKELKWVVFLLLSGASYLWVGGFHSVLEWRALQRFDQQLHHLVQKLPTLSQQEGILSLETFLGQVPDYAATLERAGDLYAHLQRWERAELLYGQAYAKKPNLSLGVAYLNAISMNHAGKLSSEAEGVLEGLLQQYPDNPNLWNLKALQAFSKGQYTLAREYWERLLLELNESDTLYPLVEEALAKVKQKSLEK